MSSSKAEKGAAQLEDDVVAAPPDGGYGWVITLLAFINWFFCLGIVYSIGTLLDELVRARNNPSLKVNPI